ncbi:hypothetical protein AB6A40_008457 [Gnathostoma spinigerum]|uniref:Uncharacterized protein n=1 Tax=Gnathostoma spinigerum TaxID=75299 RepID=A0ABD6EXE6_9BILA
MSAVGVANIQPQHGQGAPYPVYNQMPYGILQPNFQPSYTAPYGICMSATYPGAVHLPPPQAYNQLPQQPQQQQFSTSQQPPQ